MLELRCIILFDPTNIFNIIIPKPIYISTKYLQATMNDFVLGKIHHINIIHYFLEFLYCKPIFVCQNSALQNSNYS